MLPVSLPRFTRGVLLAECVNDKRDGTRNGEYLCWAVPRVEEEAQRERGIAEYLSRKVFGTEST